MIRVIDAFRMFDIIVTLHNNHHHPFDDKALFLFDDSFSVPFIDPLLSLISFLALKVNALDFSS